MIVVPDDEYSAFFRFGGIKAFGLTRAKVTRAMPHPAGITSVCTEAADIQEWTIDGETVARKVVACGRQMAWLRHDLAEHAKAVLAAERTEIERIKDDVRDLIGRDRQRQSSGRVVPFVPSAEMVKALFRHQSRTGRLHDRTSRGDETRARMAMLLERADMMHDGEDV